MTVKVAIVGFAHGHVGQYLKMWQEHPEWGVVATSCWDHDAERLTKSAQTHKLNPCSDLDAMLADPAINAVVICTETSLHADMVEKAAAAGKAIALQKPLALTMQEADRICAAVTRYKVPFTMVWQMRVDPQNHAIKELMENGSIGRVFQFRRRHGLGVCLNPAFADTWHVAPDKNRDIWADDSAHPIDLIYWLFGMPETVTAEVVSLHNPRMPNDNGIAIFRYPNGPLVEVTCSFTCAGAEISTEVYGDKGSIQQDYGDAISASLPRAADAVGLKYYLKADNSWHPCDIPSPHSQGERIAGLAKPMADFFQGKAPAIASAEDGRNALQIVLATYVSNREGRRVAINDPAIKNV